MFLVLTLFWWCAVLGRRHRPSVFRYNPRLGRPDSRLGRSRFPVGVATGICRQVLDLSGRFFGQTSVLRKNRQFSRLNGKTRGAGRGRVAPRWLRRVVGHDDRTRRGEHATDAVAPRPCLGRKLGIGANTPAFTLFVSGRPCCVSLAQAPSFCKTLWFGRRMFCFELIPVGIEDEGGVVIWAVVRPEARSALVDAAES